MKKTLIIFLLLLSPFCLAESLLDADYNFIDTAFEGIKPVTNKEFDDTINRLTPQPVENTFGGRLRAFLFGPKYGVETPPPAGQEKEIDIGADKKAIEDLMSGVQYIRLTAPIVSIDGSIIPLGNYKIKEEDSKLAFYQGRQLYGKLSLKKFEDNLKKENDITYSRVDILSDSIIRIVYSTLDDTKCAVARVYLQN